MIAHGEMRNAKLAPDLLVGEPAQHATQNVFLPGGKVVLRRLEGVR